MIGHLVCEEPVCVRVSYGSGHGSVEVYIRCSGCAGCLAGQVGHPKGRWGVILNVKNIRLH